MPPMPSTRAGPCGVVAPLVAGGVAILLVLATAGAPERPDPHRAGADCAWCHTADAAQLERDPAAARAALRPDLDARCSACHSGEGPSHRTGIRPTRPVPADLPLSDGGLITCSTCHYPHGEGDRRQAYERMDNRRGRLCLACHTLSELQ